MTERARTWHSGSTGTDITDSDTLAPYHLNTTGNHRIPSDIWPPLHQNFYTSAQVYINKKQNQELFFSLKIFILFRQAILRISKS